MIFKEVDNSTRYQYSNYAALLPLPLLTPTPTSPVPGYLAGSPSPRPSAHSLAPVPTHLLAARRATAPRVQQGPQPAQAPVGKRRQGVLTPPRRLRPADSAPPTPPRRPRRRVPSRPGAASQLLTREASPSRPVRTRLPAPRTPPPPRRPSPTTSPQPRWARSVR